MILRLHLLLAFMLFGQFAGAASPAPITNSDPVFGGAYFRADTPDINEDGVRDLLFANFDDGKAFVLSGSDFHQLLTFSKPDPELKSSFAFSAVHVKKDEMLITELDLIGSRTIYYILRFETGLQPSAELFQVQPAFTNPEGYVEIFKIQDTNGDGTDELVFWSFLQFMSPVVIASGNDPFQVLDTIDVGNSLGTASALPDINGDGIDELLITRPYAVLPMRSDRGKVDVYSYDGTTSPTILYTVTRPVIGSSSTMFGLFAYALPDITHDGIADFAVVGKENSNARDEVYLFSGADGASLAGIDALSQETFHSFGIIAMPDMDGDGVGDILVGLSNPSEATQINFYSGKTRQLISQLSPGLSMVPCADRDGDSVPDAIVFEYTGNPSAKYYLYSRHSLGLDKNQIGFGNSPTIGASQKQMLQLENEGITALTVQDISISGDATTSFSHTSQETPFIIPGLGKYELEIEYNPQSLGNHSATLTITSDDDSSPTVQIPLTGNVQAPHGFYLR